MQRRHDFDGTHSAGAFDLTTRDGRRAFDAFRIAYEDEHRSYPSGVPISAAEWAAREERFTIPDKRERRGLLRAIVVFVAQRLGLRASTT